MGQSFSTCFGRNRSNVVEDSELERISLSNLHVAEETRGGGTRQQSEFNKFLLSPSSTVHVHEVQNEYDVEMLIRKMRTEMLLAFQKMNCDFACKNVQVHLASPTNVPISGCLGSFYRFFFLKSAFTLLGQDAKVPQVENYNKIFPFLVDEFLLPVESLPIINKFEEPFRIEIRNYMTDLFGEDDTRRIMHLLFANIIKLRDSFPKTALEELETLMSSVLHEMKLNKSYNERLSKINTSIFSSFDRPTNMGADRYCMFRSTYNDICREFRQPKLANKSKLYYRYLPEINYYEMFSLLDFNLFENHKEEYTQRLKKYLYFFGHILKSGDTHAKFFIDDLLYECLKHLKTYQEDRSDPIELQYVIWMMALVHRRKYTSDENAFKYTPLSREHLTHIKEYIELIPNIETAIVNYHESCDLLKFDVCLLVDDVMYDIGIMPHSTNKHLSILAIKASFSSRHISKIVYYNPYKGVETSLVITPYKERIINLIGKYNRVSAADRNRISFLTNGLEPYFETFDSPRKQPAN